jgi:hypothetical protein
MLTNEQAPNPAPANSPSEPQSAPPSSAAPPAAASPPNPSEPPVVARPDWVPEAAWDEKAGVKLEELGKSYGDLAKFKADTETAAAERAAQIPAEAKDYGFELPKDLKLPEGVGVDEKSGLWTALQDSSKEIGLTKDQYTSVAGRFVQALAAEQTKMAEAYKAEQTEMFKALGDNGAARIDAVKSQMTALFGEKVGAQFGSTLFTPDIVKGFEQVFTALRDQGVTSFNGAGRGDSGRTDGKPEGWDSMSALDKRTWQLGQQQGASR